MSTVERISDGRTDLVFAHVADGHAADSTDARGVSLITWCAFGSGEAIDLLLDAGAVIDARDMHGDTPLTWASWHARTAFILEKLCYGNYSVHPDAVRRSLAEHGTGRGGLESNLLGHPHL